MVEIDQRDISHPATRQRFSSPGTDTAHTHHGNAAMMQRHACAVAVQAIQSAETALMILM